MSQHTCKAQRTTFESWFSPSTLWVLRSNSAHQAWRQELSGCSVALSMFIYKSLCGYIVPFLLHIYLKVELLGHLVTLGLFFLKHHSFLMLLHYFKFLQAMSEDSDFFRPSATHVDPSDGKGYFIVLLICISSVDMKAGAYFCVEGLSFWCWPGLLNSELLSFSGIPIFFPGPLLWKKSKAVEKFLCPWNILFSSWTEKFACCPFEWQEQPRVRFHHPQESVSDLTPELMEAVGVVGTWQVSTCGRDLTCKGGAKTVSLCHSSEDIWRSGHEQGTETLKRQGSCPRHVNQVKNVPQSCWTSLSLGGTPSSWTLKALAGPCSSQETEMSGWKTSGPDRPRGKFPSPIATL